MLIIAAVASSYGDPNRILYGQDYTGAQCGAYKHVHKRFTHYPRLNQDMIEWAQEQGADLVSDPDLTKFDIKTLTTIKLTGVCVTSCPRLGDVVCTDVYMEKVQAPYPRPLPCPAPPRLALTPRPAD